MTKPNAELTATAAAWMPIANLPDNWKQLASPELRSLTDIWKEESRKLKNSDALKLFNERLIREWAIETGIIEGLYSIDRGITITLIEKGLETALLPHGSTDKAPELVIRILRDHKNVLEGLFDFVKHKRELTTSYIKEIHAQLTAHQTTTEVVDQFGQRREVELVRGDWKRLPNNPTRDDGSIHYYCPPEHTASEMDRLVDLFGKYERMGVTTEVLAAWLHHRFTQIHPFQDGNGRVARALASLVLIRGGAFPLTIHRDARSSYIGALERADASDLKPLVDLIVATQKRAFVTAISTSKETLDQIVPVQEVIGAAVERLQAKFQRKAEKQRHVFKIQEVLKIRTRRKLEEIRDQITAAFRQHSNIEMPSVVSCAEIDDRYFYKRDAIELSEELGYYADVNSFNDWCRLRIGERQASQAWLVISFHSVGPDFIGVLGATAFLKFRNFEDAGESTWTKPVLICSELFQFAFNENDAEVEARYQKWLNAAIFVGLEQWRRQL